MKVRAILRYTVIVFCALVFASEVGAQPFSYVYIQGDKDVPFYVKLEGQMMPRYGKNYCILSELSPGPKHIEILFQQRVQPSQKFTINVPENGYRGLLLAKQDTEYVLYDLLQKKYLGPNGDE